MDNESMEVRLLSLTEEVKRQRENQRRALVIFGCVAMAALALIVVVSLVYIGGDFAAAGRDAAEAAARRGQYLQIALPITVVCALFIAFLLGVNRQKNLESRVKDVSDHLEEEFGKYREETSTSLREQVTEGITAISADYEKRVADTAETGVTDLKALSDSARAEYEALTGNATASYEALSGGAVAEYETLTGNAKAEYAAITGNARAEYEALTATSKAEYETLSANARAELGYLALSSKTEFSELANSARLDWNTRAETSRSELSDLARTSTADLKTLSDLSREELSRLAENSRLDLTGLTDRWRQAADAHIRIPMLGRLDSLNVSVSAAILLFEAVRQRSNG